jgi:hypothetical protein
MPPKTKVVSLSLPIDLCEALERHRIALGGLSRSRMVARILGEFCDELAGHERLPLAAPAAAPSATPFQNDEDPQAVRCFECGAKPGEPCVTISGKLARKTHEKRWATVALGRNVGGAARRAEGAAGVRRPPLD